MSWNPATFPLKTRVLSLTLLLCACTDKDVVETETGGADTSADRIVDVDGDGVAAGVDCDDTDATVGEAQPWFLDSDGDEYGDPGSDPLINCDPLTGFVDNAEDCDDTDAEVHPGADEFCDELDNDCDETIDEDAVDTVSYCADEDEDGYGAQDNCESLCEAPSGWLEDASDCDDSNAAISPDADEECNDLDDDCDGEIDNDIDIWNAWLDVDGDGYGDPEAPVCGESSDDSVDNDDDCDDRDDEINPDGTETCDGFDEDCDGVPDDSVCSCPVEVYDGRPYQMCDGDEKWEDARDACEADGYHLVTMDDDKENTWVSDTAANYRNHDTWWIGYSDLDVEETWTWSDGSSTGYDNWNRGEPNGGTGENCAHLYTNHHQGHGVWNDENCDSSKHYVCEFGS